MLRAVRSRCSRQHACVALTAGQFKYLAAARIKVMIKMVYFLVYFLHSIAAVGQGCTIKRYIPQPPLPLSLAFPSILTSIMLQFMLQIYHVPTSLPSSPFPISLPLPASVHPTHRLIDYLRPFPLPVKLFELMPLQLNVILV